MAKDETEVGITGQPVPKPRTAKQQHELEKKRRMKKHLGKNVGGTQYSSDVNPYLNPRSVREEVIVDYLLGEGFACDKKSAQAIAGAMSEEWKQSIVEMSPAMQNLMSRPSNRIDGKRSPAPVVGQPPTSGAAGKLLKKPDMTIK